MDFLIALGPDVEITVRPTRKQRGQVSIVLAGSSPRGSWLEDVIIVDWSKPELGYDPDCSSLSLAPATNIYWLVSLFQRLVGGVIRRIWPARASVSR